MPRAIARRRAAAGLAVAAGFALGAASSAAAAQTSRPDTHRLQIQLLGVRDGRVGIAVATAGAIDYDVRIVVRRDDATIATGRLASVGPKRRTVSLTVRRGVATGGRLTVDVTARRHPPVAQTTS